LVDLYKNRRQLYAKRETVQKTIQNHKIHKIENKNAKQKTNAKIILKNLSRVIIQ